MKVISSLSFTCSNCKGRKYIGDEYYAMSKWFVDVTCIKCGHSRDIEVIELYKLCKKLGDENARIVE